MHIKIYKQRKHITKKRENKRKVSPTLQAGQDSSGSSGPPHVHPIIGPVKGISKDDKDLFLNFV